MLERINLIIKTNKLSASQFADMVGVQRSSVSHVLSGRNKPSLEFIQKVLRKFPEIYSDWLLFGKGSMSNTTDLFSSVDDTVIEDNSSESHQDGKERAVPDVGPDKSKNVSDDTKSSKPPIAITPKAKDIIKVVLFYNDKTFSEYIPE